MLTTGGEPLQLTNDVGSKLVSSFSADGTKIYYRRDFGREETWAVPTLGGKPEFVVAGLNVEPSSDGKYLYYFKNAGRNVIYRSEKTGINEQSVFEFKENIVPTTILPFTDPNQLLVRARMNPATEAHIYKVNLNDRIFEDLAVINDFSGDFAWYKPDHSILLRKRENGIENIWKFDLDKKKFTQVTFGPGPDLEPMPDRGGGIYYVNGRGSGALVRYDSKTGEVKRIIEEVSSQPVISPDGKMIMFLKFGSGNSNDQLWISPTDGSSRGIRIGEGTGIGTGDWTRDSSRFVFLDINKPFVGSADGRKVKALKPMEGNISNMIWSSDGKSIYMSVRTGQNPDRTIWKVSPETSDMELVTQNGFVVGDITSDGKYLIGRATEGEKTGISSLILETKESILLIRDVPTMMVRIAPDDQSFLYAVESDNNEILFYRANWKNGKLIGSPEVALKVPFSFPLSFEGNGYDFTRDLSTIIFAQPAMQADIYLLSH